MYAVRFCDPIMVKLLLDKGVNPSCCDKQNRNGLVFAIGRNDEIILRSLIAAGSDINRLDDSKADPLKYAIDALHLAFVKLLLRNGASLITFKKRANQLVMIACDFNDMELFNILIEKGVSHQEMDEHRNNPAMRAFICRNIDMTKRLLEGYMLKNNINNFNREGNTLLVLAIKAADESFVQYLLNTCEKIDLNLRNKVSRL